MSVADFLLSPEVQQIIKITYAQTNEPFTAAALANMTRLELPAIESTLSHLAASGILARTEGSDDQPATHAANTSFLFYPELRRIALKSFAAAEPLRAMLRSKFRDSVIRAILLGEDEAAGAADLLIVHGASCPPKDELDAALQKLRKSGAVRLHLRVQVLSDTRFDALPAHDPLRARLDSGLSFPIIAAGETKARPSAGRASLLDMARRRLAGIAF